MFVRSVSPLERKIPIDRYGFLFFHNLTIVKSQHFKEIAPSVDSGIIKMGGKNPRPTVLSSRLNILARRNVKQCT